jgi:hypothetical protein
MLSDVITYLSAHPAQLATLCLTTVLAVVGLWYVLAHHLEAIIITLLSAAGFGSGLLVLYRGYNAEMRDLVGIGFFLIAVFPIIFLQAIKQLEPVDPAQRPRRGARAKAMFSRKFK